jgi:hypothetical protein
VVRREHRNIAEQHVLLRLRSRSAAAPPWNLITSTKDCEREFGFMATRHNPVARSERSPADDAPVGKSAPRRHEEHKEKENTAQPS